MIPLTPKDITSLSALTGYSEEKVLEMSKNKEQRKKLMYEAGQSIGDIIFGVQESLKK